MTWRRAYILSGTIPFQLMSRWVIDLLVRIASISDFTPNSFRLTLTSSNFFKNLPFF